jgi:alpha-ketoglutarate-dependent taurine dioxygenase
LGVELKVRNLRADFGSEITGLVPAVPLDQDTCQTLKTIFDERSLLVFRGLSIDIRFQTYLAEMLSGNSVVDHEDLPIFDGFYVSNEKPSAAAPFGRLMYHSDSQWCERRCEVLSLYGEKVEQPAVPTLFVSSVAGWETLPGHLRARVEGRHVVHQHDAETYRKRAGGDAEVLVNRINSITDSHCTPIALRHPRTGRTILYVSQQMTRNVEGMTEDESDELLSALFDHLYEPGNELEHYWREGDLVIWDNLAMQHARPNVQTGGPARTLRKTITPPPNRENSGIIEYSKAGGS